MDATHRPGRVHIHDWIGGHRKPNQQVPSSLKRALCDLLVAGWLRNYMPEAFYRRTDGQAPEGMRSVQMLIHTSAKVKDHALDYALVELGLQQIRDDIEATLRDGSLRLLRRDDEGLGSVGCSRSRQDRRDTLEMPVLGVEQLWNLGNLVSRHREACCELRPKPARQRRRAPFQRTELDGRRIRSG